MNPSARALLRRTATTAWQPARTLQPLRAAVAVQPLALRARPLSGDAGLFKGREDEDKPGSAAETPAQVPHYPAHSAAPSRVATCLIAAGALGRRAGVQHAAER